MAVSFRTVGAWTELTADGTVAIPATPQAGDRMYLFARWKDFSITASVANWTELTEFADGSVSSGNGTGSVKVGCWYRDWQSGDTDPTIDFSVSPTNASVVIIVMAKASTDTWLTPVAVTAAMTNWTTSSQSVSASSTANVLGGGVVMGLIGIRDDSSTMTRPTTNGIDDVGGLITWNGNYVEAPATHHSTTTGDDGAADLGYRLVSEGATATLRMTGTISAAETGAALWIVQGVEANLVVQDAVHAHGAESPVVTQVHSITVADAVHEQSVTNIGLAQEHAISVQAGSHSHAATSPTLEVIHNLVVQNASHAHSVESLALSQVHDLVVANAVHAHTADSPLVKPRLIIWLDPGGDAVQAVGYFNTEPAASTGNVSFDSTQQYVGVGSWKFDSADNNPAFVQVPNVMAVDSPNSRRVSARFRYDSVPDVLNVVTEFTSSHIAYSGGGFTDAINALNDNAVYATAAPAKNAGQGSFYLFSPGFSAVPVSAIIDSVRIIYERKYDTVDSIGISRVKWEVNGVEGPNHDDTNEPTTDTVVTVDVTADRAWEWQDLQPAAFKVIAEARRGDTDTSHTQSWDYVKVEVVYHLATTIMRPVTSDGLEAGFNIALRTQGAGAVLQFIDGAHAAYDGITLLAVDTWSRISFAYVLHDVDDLDINIYINGVLELSIVGTSSGGETSLPHLQHGWCVSPGVDHLCWFDQLYIDDGDDLSDPGNILQTAKLPASVNENEWNGTGGTGAVNERPLSTTNYRNHTALTVARQTYTLQTAAVGDVDISGETVVGYMGWAWFNWGQQQDETSPQPFFVVNGGDGTGLNFLMSTVLGPRLLSRLSTSSGYPSELDAIGIAANVDWDDFILYECGIVVAYEGPDTDDPLLPLQLLQEDTSASTSDTMGGTPPAAYELRNEVLAVPNALVTTTIYSLTAEGETPQQQAVIESSGGDETGIVVVNPGTELSVNIDVAGADVSVGLRRVDELVV